MKLGMLGITAVFAALACAVAGAEDKMPVFLNFDETHFNYSRSSWSDVGEREVRDFVRQYRGTDVTDFLFCIGGRIAGVSNGVKMCWLDKYDQKRENGEDVCYTNHPVAVCAKRIQRDLGIDPYAMWIEEAHLGGFRAWLSFRMNDCHATLKPTSSLHPDFYHEHPEYRRIRHRKARGYFDRCFDFGIKAVRDRELAYIGEMLGRYEMDGVEIDWMREPHCFVPGREDADVITDLMRRVRALADAAAKRLGRQVRVSARVPANPVTALEMGFDAAGWAEEGLVDVLSPCPRWRTTDPNLPVGVWKRLLRHTNVPVVPGVELLTGNTEDKPFLYQTKEQLYGNLNALYSSGADGVYLYNFFDDPRYDTQAYFSTGRQPFEGMAVYYPTLMSMLRTIGSPAMVAAADRDHMLTFEDLVPHWRIAQPPFPVKAAEMEPRFFRIVTGAVHPAATVTVRLGVEGADTPSPSVAVNGRPCGFLRKEKCVPAFTMAPLHVYSVTGMVERSAVVEVISDQAGATLTHLDIQVRGSAAYGR